ncbi:MAG: CarD family transcriptional regulator [Nitrospinota bacterium]|nr:CarD family transcriptional regulator [Nitrospinota bacterium]
MPDKSFSRFKVGAKIVYPSYGLGVVEKIEQLKMSGNADAFYIIRLRKNGMTVMAPMRSADSIGLRCVINKKEIPKILAILGNGLMENIEPNWNKRQKLFLEMIKTGALTNVAKVYRALFKLKESKGLSFIEQQVFDNAYELIVSEIAESKGIGKDKAAELVGKALEN